jgi:serine/threonine-protein kinase
MHLEPPTALQDERFLLLCALGQGGMASVYRAFDRIEQRIVALKVLRDRAREGPAHPLSTEYEAWTRLRHANVVQAFELSVARRGPLACGTPYLVLEHVEGPSLERGAGATPLAPAELERIALQLLRGLAHVSDSGLVHRDVKPSNVLVAREGGRTCYKLTDFGLAVPRGQADESGCISGSLPYVSPESLLGRPLDSRADLYALGILLFQLATGRLPMAGTRLDEILRWHLVGPPADPRRTRPRVPEHLARLVRRLTARDPDERPRDPREALRLLERVGPSEAAETVPCVEASSALPAGVRLALDAVRLGASRTLRLDPRATAPGLARQLRGVAHVFGLGFHDLAARGNGGAPPLLGAVLQLLVERCGSEPDLFERFELERCLPLAAVGGVHVADRTRGARAPVPAAARRVAEFLVHGAASRGLVLHAPADGGSCPLTRGVVAALAGRLVREGAPRPHRRGLLLVLGAREAAGAAQAPVCHCAR